MEQNNFAVWLRAELKSQGLSQADLSRVTGLHTGSIANVLNGQRKPGVDFVMAVARGLRIKPEEMYRHAGLLPPKPSPTHNPTLDEMIDVVRRLSDDDRKEIVAYARFKYQQATKKGIS